jgi:hypothetical protein
MPKQPDRWRNVSDGPVSLASGTPLAPGEDAPCPMTDPHDQAHRDEGRLVRVETEETKA